MNLTYATVVSEQGGDPAEARRKIDTALKATPRTARPSKRPKTAVSGRAMSLADAKRLGADIDRHDTSLGKPKVR